MNITVAKKTLNLIDSSIEKDQGNSYRRFLGQVLPHIGDAYREDEEGFRSHLGASLIGSDCPRNLWYGFHWTRSSKFDGRILRLFNRGHLEEGRFIAMLLSCGIQMYQQDAEGNQFRVSDCEGHFGGSSDGVAIGVPDVPPGTPCLVEFKTHSEKSFSELAGKPDEWRKFLKGTGPFTGKGVRDAKFEHYVQMNIYMSKMGLPCALYMAVSKNTDDVYAEIIVLDSYIAAQYTERAFKIITMENPPEKINNSPGYYKCKFCDHLHVCHLRGPADKNCRTCKYAAPITGKAWFCAYSNAPLSKDQQLAGCEYYVQREM